MKKIKERKGFTGIDISIAIVVVVITIGIAISMLTRISNQIREIEVDTIVNGKLNQEINEIQKRKSQGENLSRKRKNTYCRKLNGDKVLIKKTVRGQQMDYREVNIEKKNNISDSDGSELGRLSNIVDMYDYEYQDVKIKVNLVLVESYYKVNAEGKKELKFRKKTQNLLEKDQLFGKDLGVFLATNENNIAQDGNVINNRDVRIWMSKLARRVDQSDNIYLYQKYVVQKLRGEEISDSDKNSMPNLNGIYKQVEYDKNTNKKYVYINKDTKTEVVNADMAQYIDVYFNGGGINNDQRNNPKGFWFKLEDYFAGDFGIFRFREGTIAEYLTKELLARIPDLKQEILQNRITINKTFKTIENNYIEQ